jgi:glucose-1-phosphate adenylyltransferase
MYRSPDMLPPAAFAGAARLSDAYVAPGCKIGDGVRLRSCIIGARAVIADGCDIEDSVIMGADGYDDIPAAATQQHGTCGGGHANAKDAAASAAAAAGGVNVRPGRPPQGIGARTVIRRAIVDKNAHIGAGVRLVNEQGAHTASDLSSLGASSA